MKGHFLKVAPFLLLAALLFQTQPAHSKSKWALGLGTGWLQDYPGAAQGRLRFLPFPVYRGSSFRIDRISGVSGDMYRDSAMDFTWNFIFQFPTASSDIPARAGMPDLDWLLSLGPEFKYYFFTDGDSALYFRFPVRVNTCTNFSNRTRFCGLVFNPGFRYTTIDNKWGEITFRWEAFSQTSEFQEYFYEVSPKYATPTRPAFHARAGFVGFVYGIFHTIPFENWEFSYSANIYDHSWAINDESPLFLHKTTYAFFTAVTVDL